ncbi:MAG: hypothetical protein IJR48_07595, partial [Oscillibacter sp.]|nr:hypothetical protein [Oscillibacter sp.]
LWQANGSKTSDPNSDGVIWKTTDSGKNDVSKVRLPWQSVVRLKVEPDASATPNGIRYRTSYNGEPTVTYFQTGNRKYSSVDGNTVIDANDVTQGEFVLSANEYLATPNTNAQSLYVGYSPQSYNSMRSTILPGTGRSDLTGVARVGSIADLSGQQTTTSNKAVTDTTGQQTSDAEGKIWVRDARTGQSYTISAMAPDGYYTSWGNLSGDTNNDGRVDKSGRTDQYTARSDADRSDNPRYVYGDTLNVRLDIDNMRYYYKFVRLPTSGNGNVKRGYIMREKNTFLRLTKNQPATGTEPIAGANVNIAGAYGLTDANGLYTVNLPVMEDWGAVSFMASSEGSSFYGQEYIEDDFGTKTLPALEQFRAVDTTLNYARATSSISRTSNATTAMITNDNMTITAKVATSNSITPAAARFFIYDKNGTIRVNCADDPTNYRVTFDRNSYTASMTWNPKQEMQGKDTVWVQFQDNSGKWYPPIDMGYKFVNEISLNNFSLESIGGTTVDGAESTGET